MKERSEARFARLREKAESVLRHRFPDADRIPKQDIDELINEVQVYQVELEIQNEELRQAQKELGQSRDRLSVLYHKAPVGYAVLDEAGMLLDANRTLSEMLGKERHDLLNKPFSRFVDPEDRPLFFSRFKVFFKKPAGKTMAFRLTGGRGSGFHARLEGRFLASGGDPSEPLADQLLLIVHDITVLKNGEARLKTSLAESTRKARETAALLACSRAVLEYRDFETAARAIYDTAKALIGATAGYVALLSPDGSENELLFLDAGGRPCSVDPDLPMPIRGLRAESYRTGRAVYDNAFKISEWMRFMPEGHVTLDNVMFAPLVLEEKTLGLIGLSNKPGGFTAYDAEMAGAFGEFAAIALRNSRLLEGRDRAVAALRESEEHLSNILESISDGFFALDENLVITYFNKAAGDLLGRRPADILGKGLFEAFPEAKGSVFEEKYTRALEAKRFMAFETYFGREPYADWYDIRVYPARQGISVYFRVTTEQKKVEEERNRLEAALRHAQKMEAVGTLAGGVAHDFNNILSIILGNTELAMLDLSESDRVHEKLRECHRACLRARELVGQIMTFSRQKENQRSPMDLASVVREAVQMIRAMVPTTIEIVQNIDRAALTVLANPTQIQQIVVNLCNNAAHAMRASGGTLTIALCGIRINGDAAVKGPGPGPGDYARLTISDTGTGIPKAIMDRIFDPYFTTKPVGEGSGIGLAVVRGIAEKHGGTVTVDSEPGKGTTFQVYMPLIDEKPRQKALTATAPPRGDERILFVDDEPDMIDMAREMFHYLGYRLTPKHSSMEALETFRADPDGFDLIITDQTMPKLTGEALAREILSIRPDMPIVLCTGYSDQIDEDKARKAGIRGYLMKPISMGEMAGYVRDILDGMK